MMLDYSLEVWRAHYVHHVYYSKTLTDSQENININVFS